MTARLLLGAAWAVCLLAAWLSFPRILPKIRASAASAWLLIAAVALLARLVPNMVLQGGSTYDVKSYEIVGDLVLRGEDVYTSEDATDRHPYLPLQMYWSALARWASEAADLPLAQVVRLEPIAADVAIALWLYSRLRRLGAAVGLYGGLCYALNPVPVFVSAYHGQFDAIPAFLVLCAVSTLVQSPAGAGAWLGLGILAKSWPVLALPSMLAGIPSRRGRVALVAAAICVPIIGVAAYCLAFRTDPQTVVMRALSYNRGVGAWGYTYFFRLLNMLKGPWSIPYQWILSNGRYLTLLGLALVWLFRARKERLEAGVLTVLIAMLALTHAGAIQYLMWIIPFAIADQDYRWLTRYTVAAFPYMLLVYFTLILNVSITRILPWPQADLYILLPASLPAWLVTVCWLRKRLRLPAERGVAVERP